MNKFLERLDKKIEREVIKFVVERYGDNGKLRTWGLSYREICKLYFQEYINWLEYKGGQNV